MKKNQYKFLQIIFYLAIILTVVVIRFSGKKITFQTDDNKIKLSVVGKAIAEEEKPLENENTSSEDILTQQDEFQLINQDYIEQIDTGLYQENPDREIYGDEVILTFRLINGEFLYSKQNLPLGIFEHMLEDYQIFFNSIVADAPITEVEIIESSFSQTEEQISYEIETNVQKKVQVTVNLKTFIYKFTIV